MAIVDDIIEVARSETDHMDAATRDQFWKCLSGAALRQVRQPVVMRDPPPLQVTAMDELEAQKFERIIIPVGRYKGSRVAEAPLDYLEILADDSEFIRELRRYVRSQRFVQRGRAERGTRRRPWKRGDRGRMSSD